MRPQGSPVELERRRLRAIALLEQGLLPHEVAERVGVDRRSVRRWKRTYRRRGHTGLKARPVPGRPPKLTAAQRRTWAAGFSGAQKRSASPPPCGPASESCSSSASASTSPIIRIM
jgi:hypothetical protein